MENTQNTNKLERKLSPMNVWALAFGCIIGWGAFVMPGTTFLGKAGPLGTAIGVAGAALIMIVIAFNYNFLINRYPFAGGEFTFTQKTFGGLHAFICSWFLGLAYLAPVPLNATALALIGRNLLNNVFQVGFHYTVAGYDIYFGEVALAVVALLLFAWLSIRGTRFTGRFQTILIFSLVGGVLVISAAAFFKMPMTSSTFAPAFYPGSNHLGGILAVVAVAPWAFTGFDTIPQAAEEFNFSTKKSFALMVLSIFFGAFVYVVLNTVAAMIIPAGYANWAEYIADLPNLNGLASMPVFNAAHELLGAPGLIFIGIAVLGAILSGIVGFYMAASRLLYSIACEGVLPRWFAKLHPKYKTPSHAILFIMAIALIAPFFGRDALGWIVDMSSIGAAIGYGYTSAACFKIAHAEKRRALMVTGVLGICFSVLFAVLLLVPIPQFDCSLGKESYICLIIWCALGIIFYAQRRRARSK